MLGGDAGAGRGLGRPSAERFGEAEFVVADFARWAKPAKVWAETDPGFAIANTSGRRAPDASFSRHTLEPEAAATSLQILLDSRSEPKIDAVAVVRRPPGTTTKLG